MDEKKGPYSDGKEKDKDEEDGYHPDRKHDKRANFKKNKDGKHGDKKSDKRDVRDLFEFSFAAIIFLLQ
jgi:hypothetical protein